MKNSRPQKRTETPDDLPVDETPDALPVDESSGVVHADEAYTLEAFERRTGLKEWARRNARCKGLPIRRAGCRAFILGRDWIEYLAECESE